MIKYFLALCFTLLIPFLAMGQDSDSDTQKLNDVVSVFQESIEKKDSSGFNQLFFKPSVPFVGIMSKETEWSIKKDYPEFEGISTSTHEKFIREICETEKRQKENVYQIEISHNGVIASISFNYSFLSDTKMIQWGLEKWNLVKVDGNWLITDVIYSIHFPDVEPFPFSVED